MTAAELLDTAEVERLVLRPGDMLVVKHPRPLSDAEAAGIAEHIRTVLPGVRILLVDGGRDLAVLRAEP